MSASQRAVKLVVSLNKSIRDLPLVPSKKNPNIRRHQRVEHDADSSPESSFGGPKPFHPGPVTRHGNVAVQKIDRPALPLVHGKYAAWVRDESSGKWKEIPNFYETENEALEAVKKWQRTRAETAARNESAEAALKRLKAGTSSNVLDDLRCWLGFNRYVMAGRAQAIPEDIFNLSPKQSRYVVSRASTQYNTDRSRAVAPVEVYNLSKQYADWLKSKGKSTAQKAIRDLPLLPSRKDPHIRRHQRLAPAESAVEPGDAEAQAAQFRSMHRMRIRAFPFGELHPRELLAVHEAAAEAAARDLTRKGDIVMVMHELADRDAQLKIAESGRRILNKELKRFKGYELPPSRIHPIIVPYPPGGTKDNPPLSHLAKIKEIVSAYFERVGKRHQKVVAGLNDPGTPPAGFARQQYLGVSRLEDYAPPLGLRPWETGHLETAERRLEELSGARVVAAPDAPPAAIIAAHEQLAKLRQAQRARGKWVVAMSTPGRGQKRAALDYDMYIDNLEYAGRPIDHRLIHVRVPQAAIAEQIASVQQQVRESVASGGFDAKDMEGAGLMLKSSRLRGAVAQVAKAIRDLPLLPSRKNPRVRRHQRTALGRPAATRPGAVREKIAARGARQGGYSAAAHGHLGDWIKLKLRTTGSFLCANAFINTAADAATLLRELSDSDREKFYAINLDEDRRVINVACVSIGTLNSSLVHPREALKAAVLCDARYVAFAHNHPSGDPVPSGEDVAITNRLKAVGDALGIKVLAHVVLGAEKFMAIPVEGGLPALEDPLRGEPLQPYASGRGSTAEVPEVEIKQERLAPHEPAPQIGGPDDVVKLMTPLLGKSQSTPVMYALILDTKHRVLAVHPAVGAGEQGSEAVRAAIQNNADAVIFVSKGMGIDESLHQVPQSVLKQAGIKLLDVISTADTGSWESAQELGMKLSLPSGVLGRLGPRLEHNPPPFEKAASLAAQAGSLYRPTVPVLIGSLPRDLRCEVCNFTVPAGKSCAVCSSPLRKTHVRDYVRRTASGQMVQVKEHEDIRSARRMKPPAVRARAPAPRVSRRRQPQEEVQSRQPQRTTYPAQTTTRRHSLGYDPGYTYSPAELRSFIRKLRKPLEKTLGGLHAVVHRYGITVGQLGRPPEVTLPYQPYGGRLKAAERLKEKFETKWRHKTLREASDIAGARVICKDLHQLKLARKAIEKQYKIIEMDDYITSEHPGGAGYRGIHYILNVGGYRVELQLRTERQHWWAELAHPLYEVQRSGGKLEHEREVSEYMKQLSDYYWMLDNGVRTKEPERPRAVQEVFAKLFAAHPAAKQAAKALGLIRVEAGGLWRFV